VGANKSECLVDQLEIRKGVKGLTFLRAGHVGVTRHNFCESISLVIMSSLTPGWGSSVSQHLIATEKILQGVVVNEKYVWSTEVRRVGGLMLKFAGSRGLWMQPRLNEPTNRRVDCN